MKAAVGFKPDVHSRLPARATVIRRHRVSMTVQGRPGEWDIELAVSGEPSSLSGMVVNLSDLDRWIKTATSSLHGKSVSDARVLIEDLSQKFRLEIKNLRSRSSGTQIRFEWVAISDDTCLF